MSDIFNSQEDQFYFEVWAFGTSPVKYSQVLMYTWNSRHGDIYFVRSEENMVDSIAKMYKIYLKFKESAVDKQIRKIEKESKKVGKSLKTLEKMDKKQDKKIEKCEKMPMKKKAKK
jgi:hypothetical protein